MTRKIFRKIVVFLLFVLPASVAVGQVTKISLGVNGLTCSQCSRSVEMQLRKLTFIDSIHMNLKHTTATLSLKNKAHPNFKKIADAVRDAGFSVRYLKVSFDRSKIDLHGNCFVWQQTAFFLLGTPTGRDPKTITFQIIGKGFLPDKKLAGYSLVKNGNCPGDTYYFLLPEPTEITP